MSWNSLVARFRALLARFAAPTATALLFSVLYVSQAFAQFDPDAPEVGDLVGDITSTATTLFPWWQVAVVCALIIGFGIRFIPRIIKRMG